MKLLLVVVGHKQPEWVAAGCREYLQRLPREMAVSLIEVKPEPRDGKSREQLLAAEKARIRQRLQSLKIRLRLVVLDEKGEDLDTRRFSQRLAGWRAEGDGIALLIGSADGLDAELKAEAAETIRLSSLTLPHGLARLLLCEQLYRAASLLDGHPYHREG